MIDLAGIELGLVVRRDDPDGLGRVKVQLPGIVEESAWAEPLASPGGGGAQRGCFEPPAVGSNVGVFFHRGDPDRPLYLPGPWGAPDGSSDVPTGGEVEGQDRQLAAQEDAEWLVQRDSRSGAAPQRYRVKHKSSGVEVVIESDDNVRLVRQGANQALVRGTEYRTAEASFLADVLDAIEHFANVCKGSADPTLAGASVVLEASMVALGGHAMPSDATAYLSTKAWTE